MLSRIAHLKDIKLFLGHLNKHESIAVEMENLGCKVVVLYLSQRKCFISLQHVESLIIFEQLYYHACAFIKCHNAALLF